MTCYARWDKPHQKFDEPSPIDAKVEKQAEAASTETTVYAAVTIRDTHMCRVCAKWFHADAVGLLEGGHHHHIVYRSAQGETSLENVCLLCVKCHNAEHKHRIAIDGNAQAAPWLTLRKKDPQGRWYVWRQEIGVRDYVEVD